jgi:hypothetical protein
METLQELVRTAVKDFHAFRRGRAGRVIEQPSS